MRSYKPEELFDADGRLVPGAQGAGADGAPAHERQPARQRRRCCARSSSCPTSATTPSTVPTRGTALHENTKPLGEFLRDVMRNNLTSFRVFGPDETASNRLQAIYEASKKTWMADMLPEDADGGELARDGRVMEMLSEHTLLGWLEGYLLTGRHGFFHTYEAFAHVIDSMFNQHAKWLDICKNHVPWRALGRVGEHPAVVDGLAAGPQRLLAPGSGLHRSRHQQEPVGHARLPAARRQHAAVGRRPLPAQHRLHQRHRRRQAEAPAVHDDRRGDRALRQGPRHLGAGQHRRGRGAGRRAGLAAATSRRMEALAAAAILRERLPDLKLRFVNVVDLFKLQPASEHPHGSTEREFDSLFTTDKPIIFNFHGYPVADPQARVPLQGPREPARARLQGEGQHQHAARAGDAERDVALSTSSST